MSVKCSTLPAVCGLCLMLCSGALASAQSGVALRWQAPPECPTQAEVDAELALLGSADSSAGAGLEVSVVVERSAERWVAQVRMSGRLDAERSLEGDSCAALAKASAWLVMQAVRSLPAELEPVAEEPAPAPAPAAAAPAKRAAPPPVAAEPHTLELAIGAWWDSGALPSSSLGLGLSAALWFGSWRFALKPRVFMPSSLSSPPLPDGASASFLLAEVPLEACFALPLAALRLGPCASVVAGWMHGASEGLPDESTRASAGIWLTLEAAVAAEWRVVPNVSIRVEVGLARPLLVPQFVMSDGTPLHRTEGWLVRPGIVLGMLF